MNTTTDTTSRDTGNLVALTALAQHGIAHRLHGLTDVDFPIHRPVLSAHILRPHLIAWADSINVTEITTRAVEDSAVSLLATFGPTVRRWTITGTLPSIGVRVELRGLLTASDGVPAAILPELTACEVDEAPQPFRLTAVPMDDLDDDDARQLDGRD